MSRRFDVFLSYASTDAAWVHRLAEDLRRYGRSVWLRDDAVRPGDRFVDALEQGIAQSRAVALIVSPQAISAGWVREEYERAMDLARGEGLQLIPVLLRAAELPGFLKNRHPVDFRDPDTYAQRVADLVWGITGEKPAHVLALDPHALPVLPAEHIPEPAPLPRGSRMHLASNPLFVGRKSELCALAEALQVGKTAAIGQTAAATGLGGIGKTQLAAAFVHRYGQYFDGGVFWLSFADPASVPVGVALCGGPGHLGLWTAEATPDFNTQITMVRTAWAEPVPRLLVFDNCEDEKLLETWRPVTGGCRVLVTCRRRSFSPHLGVRTLGLDVLPRTESMALLHSFGGRPSDDNAGDATLDAICAELGDLPLALHLAGSFLARYSSVVTHAQYLTQLRDQALLGHSSLQGRGSNGSPTGHALHVGRTFALSWDQLDPTREEDALARKLMRVAACLAPGEPIPRSLLLAPLPPRSEDAEAALVIEDAIHRLLALGLIEAPEPDAYLIHRLVTAFVQQGDDDHDATRESVERALLRVAGLVNASGYPALLSSWQPHLRVVTNVAWDRQDGRAASLCDRFGEHLRALGDYAGARPYYERNLAIRKKLHGPDHLQTATSLNNLALLLQLQGDYDEALPLLQRAIAIQEKQLGPDHPEMGTSLNNLAALLQARGEYADARPLYERALAMSERQHGPEHPETATGLNNLGMLLMAQGAYSHALPLLERALRIREKHLGPEHPETAMSLHNLALLLQTDQKYLEARLLLERALAICEEQLGPDHPRTGNTLNVLAGLLVTMGSFDQARALCERALATAESQPGTNPERVAWILDNLALLLRHQEAYTEARPLYERSLAIREKHLGANHPDTARSMFQLASLIASQGEYAEARSLLERVLVICHAILGREHPNTLLAQSLLQRLPPS
jgi:tetratricopeptide (TPR) repeat protein